jgi:hypothetical protein
MAAQTETSMHVPAVPFTWHVGGAPELELVLDDVPEDDVLVPALDDALDAAEPALDAVVVEEALDDALAPPLPPMPPPPVVAGREDELDVGPTPSVPPALVVPSGAADPLNPPAADPPRRSGL